MAYSYVLAHDLAGADTLKQLLVENDGWLESDHLPAGWLFKEFQQPGLEGGRVRVVHGYQFITRHGDHLTGHNKALAELREKEEYGQQDLDRFARLLPERQAVHRTWEQDWAEVHPAGDLQHGGGRAVGEPGGRGGDAGAARGPGPR